MLHVSCGEDTLVFVHFIRCYACIFTSSTKICEESSYSFSYERLVILFGSMDLSLTDESVAAGVVALSSRRLPFVSTFSPPVVFRTAEVLFYAT